MLLGAVLGAIGPTCALAQSITVTSPAAGAVYAQNTVLPIRWTSTGITGNVHLDISEDRGATWNQSTGFSGMFNTGAYDYRLYNEGSTQYQLREVGSEVKTVSNIVPTATTMIRVRAAGSNTIFGVSGVFTVTPPSIQLISPVGGESYRLTDLMTVKWATQGYNGPIYINLSVDSGVTWWNISPYSGFPNDGQQTYQIGPDTSHPGTVRLFSPGSSSDYLREISPGARFRIRVRAGNSSGGVAAFAVSPADFALSNSAPAVPATTRMVNLSTRALVASGGNLNPGFVISGIGKQRVLVRGVGPGLAPLGVTGVMLDPVLELFSGTTRIGSNDNWSADASQAPVLRAAFASVGAFALPDGSKDAALLIDLDPGAYTVTIKGATGGGDALAEVYTINP
jgi:hypothetical protein